MSQFTDEQEDSHPIRHHRQWVSLGHSLLVEKEVTCTITRPYHQRGSVVVAFEFKPRATGPLKPHHPQHGCVVLFTERVNDEDPQSSSWVCCCHRSRTTWIPPSIPTSKPPHRCFIPQASLASAPVTTNTRFAIIRRQVSPTPTSLTPGHLSRTIRRPYIRAL